jgi:alpha-beta hydrolase superfamily lysophospholipase
MKILRIVGLGIAALVATYFLLALALIYWPVTIFGGRPPAPAAVQGAYPHMERHFRMRDGKALFARVFGAPGDTAVVLVHGFGVDSGAYQHAASLWNEASGAEIVALDLRGHGRSQGKSGRADYVGQYADDLADVIGTLRREGARRIVLAGHSMGGGVALTYALKADVPPVDAYLLISPLLGADAPTAPATGGPATATSTLYVRTPRLIGVLMFSLAHIRAFSDLPIMYLNQTPPMTYGIVAISNMGPADYRNALAAIRVPFLLVAGSRDEVFRSAAYADVVKPYANGRSVLIDGATHAGVLADPAAVGEIGAFIGAQSPLGPGEKR